MEGVDCDKSGGQKIISVVFASASLKCLMMMAVKMMVAIMTTTAKIHIVKTTVNNPMRWVGQLTKFSSRRHVLLLSDLASTCAPSSDMLWPPCILRVTRGEHGVTQRQ